MSKEKYIDYILLKLHTCFYFIIHDFITALNFESVIKIAADYLSVGCLIVSVLVHTFKKLLGDLSSHP